VDSSTEDAGDPGETARRGWSPRLDEGPDLGGHGQLGQHDEAGGVGVVVGQGVAVGAGRGVAAGAHSPDSPVRTATARGGVRASEDVPVLRFMGSLT
jgi:hypothetical protein